MYRTRQFAKSAKAAERGARRKQELGGPGRAERVRFARDPLKMAGVSVRALGHYDRLGLLKPGRTGAGYRIYADRDLERLEQIVALKFIGLALKQIGVLLGGETVELPRALRMQRRVLEEKRRLLDRAMQAIEAAESAVSEPGGRAGSAILKQIIEVMEMETNPDWMSIDLDDLDHA
jgi:MerR family transcriptional regulator, thiopeptide resistance regulator